MKRILILSFILFLNFPLLSRHLSGGYLSYSCNENLTVTFVYTIYADACCSNCGSLEAFIPVAAYICPDGNCDEVSEDNLYFTAQVELLSESFVFDESDCVPNGSESCLKKGLYSFTVGFPNANNPYLITYQRCCRAEDVVNLSLSDEQGISFSTILYPAALSSCNESPRLDEDFQRYFCVGEEQSFSIAMNDPDDDVLTYELCAGKQGGGLILTGGDVFSCEGALPDPPCPGPYDDVVFDTNYNENEPIGNGVPFSLDASTGLLTLTPNLLGRYAIGACVSEFKQGLLMSETRLEFDIYTTSLTTSLEEVTTEDIQIIPNPSSSNTTLHLPKGRSYKSIHIYSSTGQLITSLKNMDVTIPLPDQLHKGLYLVKVEDANGRIWTKKWLKT
jgi:hypothetical protein